MLVFIGGSLAAHFTCPPAAPLRDPARLQDTRLDREFLQEFARNVVDAPDTAERLHHIAKKIEFSDKLEKLDHDILLVLARKVKNSRISARLGIISEKY